MKQFEDLETGRILSAEHELSVQLMENNPEKYKEIKNNRRKSGKKEESEDSEE